MVNQVASGAPVRQAFPQRRARPPVMYGQPQPVGFPGGQQKEEKKKFSVPNWLIVVVIIIFLGIAYFVWR